MNFSKLVIQSLRFHARTGLPVLAGCAISAAVLVGALFIGDSVRGSLARIALHRLGRIHVALDAGSRHFRDDLARRLDAKASTVLRVSGMAIRDGGQKQVNRVEVLGIDGAFLGLAASPTGIALSPGEVAVNEKLASALGVKAGDEVSLRMVRPDLLSRDAPLSSGKEGNTRRSRVTLKAVLADAQLGRFSLRSDQAAPMNAFVDLKWLQDTLGLEHRANMLLAGDTSLATAGAALREAWVPEDAGLRIRTLESHGIVQLESERIYLDPAVSSAAADLLPDSATTLTYLVNSISTPGGRSTPYSFMTALSPGADRGLGPVPPGMKDDEILVNRWLADQLSVRAGDRVRVAYSELTATGKFTGRHRDFRVRRVLEMDTLEAERALVPEFPGLTDVESCRDWDIGIITDEEKLRDRANEAYWNRYRQTPKAFVTLEAGRAMWANRFGDTMAIRTLSTVVDAENLSAQLRTGIDPIGVGLEFRPVRDQASRAASGAMDLGQLFLGMSFFLVAASLLLTAMLFVFSVEKRSRDIGVLLAVGYPPRQVRRLFLAEGFILALAGSLAGVPLGIGYARFLIWGLEAPWSGAVANTSIEFHTGIGSAAMGVAAATLVSLLAMILAMGRQTRRTVRELVSEDFTTADETRSVATHRVRIWRAVFLGAVAGAIAAVAWTLMSGAARPAGGFFAAGSLMLIGGIALVRLILARRTGDSPARLTLGGLGVRNAARRPGRALATAGILASGCFIVLSVSAMEMDISARAGERHSATGGFELYGESSVAVHEDLNQEAGRRAFRLTDSRIMDGVHVLPIRVRDGDDASCLNLNLAPTPPLLGVDADTLARLGAFAAPELWGLLNQDAPEGVVPAIVGDSDTVVWKLKKKVGKVEGDLLDYVDERGRRFKVKLVAALPMRLSMFQGRLLVSDRHFTKLYPSESGFRMFLADVPAGREAAVIHYLSGKLEKVGLDVIPAVERLMEFYTVESTYLRMFLVLGGLGLLLGTAGMGILVGRNVMERRSELALLRAVGYTKRQVGVVVMAEHRFLLVAGLLTGAVAAALAILPAVTRPGTDVPFGLVTLFLFGTGILSMTWIWIATRLALRSPLVPALRDD